MIIDNSGNTTIRSGNKLIINRTDNAVGGEITYGPSAGTGFTFNDANGDGIDFKTGSTMLMSIDSTNQRVGIGTSNPAAKLHVSADSGSDSIARFQNTNSTSKLTRLQLSDSSGTVGDALIAYDHSNASSANHYLGMGVNNSTALVINNNDNVGIGVSTPSVPLHVVTSAATDSARFTDNTNSELFVKHSAGNLLTLATGSTSQPLAFGQGSSEAARIDSSQNFIVGNTSSGAASAVTLRADGVIIAPQVYSTAVSASLRDLQIDSSGFFGYSTSTRATKDNIEPLTDVSWLLDLEPVSFNRKITETEVSSEKEYGLVADDVESVNADICFYDETENGKELAGITYSKLITPILKLVQEQQTLIESLTDRIAALENN